MCSGQGWRQQRMSPSLLIRVTRKRPDSVSSTLRKAVAPFDSVCGHMMTFKQPLSIRFLGRGSDLDHHFRHVLQEEGWSWGA